MRQTRTIETVRSAIMTLNTHAAGDIAERLVTAGIYLGVLVGLFWI